MTDIDLDEIEAQLAKARASARAGSDLATVQFIQSAAAVPALVARVRELEAQRDAALVLHGQEPWIDADQFGNDQVRGVYCDECREAWPCATVRAVTGDGSSSNTEKEGNRG